MVTSSRRATETKLSRKQSKKKKAVCNHGAEVVIILHPGNEDGKAYIRVREREKRRGNEQGSLTSSRNYLLTSGNHCFSILFSAALDRRKQAPKLIECHHGLLFF